MWLEMQIQKSIPLTCKKFKYLWQAVQQSSTDYILLWQSIITACGVQWNSRISFLVQCMAVVKLAETYVSGESQFLCYVLSGLKQQIKKSLEHEYTHTNTILQASKHKNIAMHMFIPAHKQEDKTAVKDTRKHIRETLSGGHD